MYRIDLPAQILRCEEKAQPLEARPVAEAQKVLLIFFAGLAFAARTLILAHQGGSGNGRLARTGPRRGAPIAGNTARPYTNHKGGSEVG